MNRAFFLLLLLSSSAWAQDSIPGMRVDLQHLRPDPTGTGLLATFGADTLGRWVPRGSIDFHGAFAPLRLPYNGEEIVAVSGLVTMDLAGAIGFGPADLSVRVPIHWGIAAGAVGYSTLPSFDKVGGFGDVEIAGKIRIFDPKNRRLGLALRLPLTLPSGDAPGYGGFDTPTFAPAVIAEMRFPKVRLLLDVAPVVIRGTVRRWGMVVARGFTWASGARFELDPRMDVGIEIWGELPWSVGDGTPLTHFAAPHEWMVHGRFRVARGVEVTAGLGTGIGRGWGAPRFRMLVGVVLGTDTPIGRKAP